MSDYQSTFDVPVAWALERHRETCGDCGNRRMTRAYIFGVPGWGVSLCSECDCYAEMVGA